MTSGAIQFAVPLRLLNFSASYMTAICLAEPKSASLHTPLLSINMFAPLISLIIFFYSEVNSISFMYIYIGTKKLKF
jgi:hypothetical protein